MATVVNAINLTVPASQALSSDTRIMYSLVLTLGRLSVSAIQAALNKLADMVCGTVSGTDALVCVSDLSQRHISHSQQVL